MPIEIKIDQTNQIRIATVTGKLLFGDIIDKLKEVYSDHELFDLPYSIWDVRQADVSSFKANHIQRVAEFVSDNWGKEGSKKTAIIADKDLLFGLSRMYEMIVGLKTTSATMVFHNYDDAVTWLIKGTLPSSLPDETILG